MSSEKECLGVQMEKNEDRLGSLFPAIMQGEELHAAIHRADKHHYYGSIMKQYLKNKMNNRSIGDFFEKRGIRKIALYATSELAEMVIKDIALHGSQVEITAIGDKHADRYMKEFCGCKIVSLHELKKDYVNREFEKIMVCSVFFSNEIFDELMQAGIKQEDLSLIHIWNIRNGD